MASTTALTLTEMALHAADAALRTDAFVDAPGPSIHLPGPVADALLQARGWSIVTKPIRTRTVHGQRMTIDSTEYVAPDGERCWHRDDALRRALVAEAFDVDPELTEAL